MIQVVLQLAHLGRIQVPDLLFKVVGGLPDMVREEIVIGHPLNSELVLLVIAQCPGYYAI